MVQKGNFTALQRLTPIQQDFTEDLQRAEQLGFAYRREQRAKQKAIDDANKELINDIALSNSKMIPFDTKHKDLNSYVYKVVEEGKEQLPELYKKLSNPNTSMQDKIEAQTAIYNIENLPTTLKNMTKGITEHITSQNAGIADGTMIASDEYMTFMKKGFDMSNPNGLEADMILDKNYQPALLYKDDSGAIKKVGMTEFLAQDLPSNRQKFDLTGMVTTLQKQIGTDTDVKESGFRKTTIKGANDDSLAYVDRAAEGLFNIDANGKMSDALYSVWVGDLGRKPGEITQDDITELQEEFKKSVLAGVDTEDKSEVDYSARNAAARLKYDKNKEAKGYATPEISVDQNTGEPEKRQINGDVPNQSTEGYVVTFGSEVLNLDADDQRVTTRNLIVGDDGNIYADEVVTVTNYADMLNGKSAETSVEENVPLGITELNNMARNPTLRKPDGERFKDGRELKLFVEEKYKEAGGKASKEKIQGW